MPKLLLTIPGIPPPLNQYRRLTRWTQTAKKHEWQLVTQSRAKELVREFGWAPPSFAHVTAKFWFKDHRRRDPDGYTTSLKGCLDGLVDAGVIKDDDFQHISLRVVWGGVDKKHPRVEITVETVEEGVG